MISKKLSFYRQIAIKTGKKDQNPDIIENLLTCFGQLFRKTCEKVKKNYFEYFPNNFP